MKTKFWTSDKIVSFVAIIVSVFSLFIFVKQTNIIEEQNHLSVMPYLMLETANNSKDATFSIHIMNYGVGPAIIKKRTISYKGKAYDMDFHEFLEQQIPEMDSVNIRNWSTLQIGLAIPAGSDRNILITGGDRSSYQAFLGIMEELQSNGFKYEIEYKSIYNDMWVITDDENIPIRIED